MGYGLNAVGLPYQNYQALAAAQGGIPAATEIPIGRANFCGQGTNDSKQESSGNCALATITAIGVAGGLGLLAYKFHTGKEFKTIFQDIWGGIKKLWNSNESKDAAKDATKKTKGVKVKKPKVKTKAETPQATTQKATKTTAKPKIKNKKLNPEADALVKEYAQIYEDMRSGGIENYRANSTKLEQIKDALKKFGIVIQPKQSPTGTYKFSIEKA